MIYQWKRFVGYKTKPEVAGEELERIRSEHQGEITPEVVVEEARPAEAVLHPEFEWDDSLAAEAWRREQARTMLRMITVMREVRPDEAPRQVRAFVNVVREDSAGHAQQVFVSLDSAMADPDYRQQVLADALRELQSWERKYGDYQELAAIHEAVVSVRRMLAPAG